MFFATLLAEGLHNGVNFEENTTLATTMHVEQAVTLILRGLLRGQDASRREFEGFAPFRAATGM